MNPTEAKFNEDLEAISSQLGSGSQKRPFFLGRRPGTDQEQDLRANQFHRPIPA